MLFSMNIREMAFDVVALGEVLIDFTQAGVSGNGMRLFEQNPGGATANVLTALARLGSRCAFVGKVGADMHGEFLRRVLEDENIDCSGLVVDPAVFTTLAFVSLSNSGERSFSFARKPGADTCLKREELPHALFSRTKIFHFGSLSLTDEPARTATLEAITLARASGALVSYDPNYRAPLWPDEAATTRIMRSVLDRIDIIKISEEEAPLLTGESECAKSAAALLERGPSCVVITRGSAGADAYSAAASVSLPVPDVPVVDTTGAGDAFWGGFLHRLLQHDPSRADLKSLSKETLAGCVSFANATASLCVQKRGGIPAMPSLGAVNAFLGQ
jgi:fructokinase